MPVLGTPGDSGEAARRLAGLGAGCVVTLGAAPRKRWPRNRIVAQGCCDVPLVAMGDRPCTVALDGERTFEVSAAGPALEVVLDPAGPRVVDIDAGLRRRRTRGVCAPLRGGGHAGWCYY